MAGAPAMATAAVTTPAPVDMEVLSPEEAAAQQQRFAAQLSGDWNKLVMERSANGANMPLPKGVPLEPAPASVFAAMAAQGGGIVQDARAAAERVKEDEQGDLESVGEAASGDEQAQKPGRLGRWRDTLAERRRGRKEER